MLNPDITSLMDDQDVGGGQKFTVFRATSVREKGRNKPPVVEEIHATGSIQPSGQKVLQQTPEGDRTQEEIVVRTTIPLQSGSADDIGSVMADEILYDGKMYKVLRTGEWKKWGMYVAYCTRCDSALGVMP